MKIKKKKNLKIRNFTETKKFIKRLLKEVNKRLEEDSEESYIGLMEEGCEYAFKELCKFLKVDHKHKLANELWEEIYFDRTNNDLENACFMFDQFVHTARTILK